MKDFLKWVMYGAIFAVPFVLLIVSGSMFFPYITGKNFAFRILVEIAFAAWLLLALIDTAYRPRLSYILYAILGLVGVMFVASVLGEYAPKSFWSNYERMEGWVTLLHFAMYFVVLGAVLTTEKLWNYYFNTALVAAGLMSWFALGQIAGFYGISQGTEWRVDGRLGNSSYLGVYMLFHIFIAAWMLIRTKIGGWQWLYGGLIVLFVYVLSQTGTRGSMYGLIGGGLLTFIYLAIMAPRGATIKKVALGGLAAVILLTAGVWLARDTAFVQENPMLNRFASTTWAEGNVRFMIWEMALRGAQEHPILGWGQENFSYVFNEYYDPALYAAEQWYDRTHNIFLDWLVTGGVLGLLAYLSILAAALWYAVFVPIWVRFKRIAGSAVIFTVYEQALILGLLAAYMFHNLFVFDNLASWIFYAVILALIHSRVATVWTALEGYKVSQDVWQKVWVPGVGVAVAVALYLVNVPSMLAASDIIDGYRAATVTARIDSFKRAFDRGGFADQEIFEQLTQVSIQSLNTAGLAESDRDYVINAVDDALALMTEKKPGDARVHVLAGSFYRVAGDLDAAMAELQEAERLSPTKQAIIEEQGLIFLLAGRKEEAMERYRKAYELDTDNVGARVHLAAAALYFDDRALFDELLPPDVLQEKGDVWRRAVEDQALLQLAYRKGDLEILMFMTESRIELHPDDADLRVNLAALHFEQGDKERAIAIVRQAMVDIPAFKEKGEALLRQIETSDE